MATFAVFLDDHDREMLGALCRVALERKPSEKSDGKLGAGPIIRMLIYHCELFKAEILQELTVPPMEGERREKLCIRMTGQERETLRALAELCSWSMSDLVRALIEYHWILREEYLQSQPALTYAEHMSRSWRLLSFQPDRLNPWYCHERESKQRMEETATESRKIVAAQLREAGLDGEHIEQFFHGVEVAKEVRDSYMWDDKAKSPAATRDEERRADEAQHFVGTNQFTGPGGGEGQAGCSEVAVVLVFGLGTLALIAWGGWYVFTSLLPMIIR